jgi:hypothetical protein
LTLLRGPVFGLSLQNFACSLGQLTSLAGRLFSFFECLAGLFVFGLGKPDSLPRQFGYMMCFSGSQNELPSFSFGFALPGITAFHISFRF